MSATSTRALTLTVTRRAAQLRASRPASLALACAAPLAVFGTALAVYLHTLRPSFGWLDSSELTTAAYHLGIGHNPGYPTFMLIGHVFSWLPVGSIAYRLNLMAAVCGALAVALLYLVCVRVTRSRVASALAALTAAFSYTLWDLTTEAEVYTLHACFMMGALLLFVRWRDQGRQRDLYLAWLVVGASLGNHPLTILMIPALAVLMRLGRERRDVAPARAWRCAAAVLAGAAVYLYVPLRALANPPPEVNNPHNLRQFLQLLTAPGYRDVMFSRSASEVALRALGFARHIVRELGPWGIGVALLGVVIMAQHDRRLTAALLLLLVLDVAYALNYDIFDIYAYFLPAYLVLAVFIAAGLERALAWGAQGLAWFSRGGKGSLTQPARVALVAALLTYLPAWTFGANFALVDASRDYAAEDFARNTFEIVEPGAVIIGDWYSIAPLGYLKYVEGLRPDVTLSVGLSAYDPSDRRRVMEREFLAAYPAAYLVEHQTSHKRAFTERYPHVPVGDLVRLYPEGRPRLRARPGGAEPTHRFGDRLGLVATVCEPAAAPQGGVVRISHRWLQLAPLNQGLETLTSLEGEQGCVWRVRCDLAHGFYTAQTWRPGEVAEERHVAFLPSDAPPGKYRVTVRVRDKLSKRGLPAVSTLRGALAAQAECAVLRITARQPHRPSPTLAPRRW